MLIDEDLYLEHYGVKGMKWGVRKNKTNKSSKKQMSTKQKLALGSSFVSVLIGSGIVLSKLKKSSKPPSFNIDVMNKAMPELYKEGIIWDKPDLGRDVPELPSFIPKNFYK